MKSGDDEQQRQRLRRAFGARDRLRGGGAERRRETALRRERAGVDLLPRARGEALGRLDPAHHRVGPGPAGGDIVPPGGRARPPRRLAELLQQADRLRRAELR